MRKRNEACPQHSRPAQIPTGMSYGLRVRNTSEDPRSAWAAFARAAREQQRVSQSELARRLDVERSTIWRWETGKQRPESIDIVTKFAEVLNIELDEALAAAGLKPGATPPREPSREPDEEIDLVMTDPRLSDDMKQRIVKLILERRERDRVAAIEETRRMIDLFGRI